MGLSKTLIKDGLNIYHGLSHELPRNIHKTSIKTVVTIHDLLFIRYPQLYPFIDRKIYHAKFRYSCKIADKIVAVSEQTKKDIIEFFNIDPKKIQVVYQSCSSIFYTKADQQTKAALRTKYKLPAEFILYVGAITERKNLLSLLKATDQLQPKLKVPLVIVGNGKSYLQKIKAHTVSDNRRIHLEKQVIFLQHIPSRHLPAIYQMAQLFCYPSLFEGFGIPIIEALHSKTPVITSTGSCFSEAGGASSIYVPPKDIEALTAAIEKVLTDNELRKKMIDDGYQYVQKFHPKNTSAQLMSLYERVISD